VQEEGGITAKARRVSKEMAARGYSREKRLIIPRKTEPQMNADERRFIARAYIALVRLFFMWRRARIRGHHRKARRVRKEVAARG